MVADLNFLEAAVTFTAQGAAEIDSEIDRIVRRLGSELTNKDQIISTTFDTEGLEGAISAADRLKLAMQQVDEEILQASTRDIGANIVQASIQVDNLQETTAGMNRLGRSTNQVTNFLSQVAFAAQDAQFGFQGVANNIQPIIENFSRLAASEGGASSAFAAINASIGSLITAIPGLTAALATIGAGGVVAGVAGITGQFDELRQSVGNLGTAVSSGIGSLGSVINSALGDPFSIVANQVDGVIRFVNTLADDLQALSGAEIDVSGTESVKAAREEIQRLKSEVEANGPAAQALQRDIAELYATMSEGSNDTLIARQRIRGLQEEFSNLTAAQAVASIEEYNRSLQEASQTRLETDLSEALGGFEELTRQIQTIGGDTEAAQSALRSLAESLTEIGQNEAEEGIRRSNQALDDLTSSERTRLVEDLEERLQSLFNIQARTDGLVDFSNEIDQLSNNLANVRENVDAFDDIEKAAKKAAKEAADETERLQRAVDKISESGKTAAQELQEAFDALRDGAARIDIDLDFQAAAQGLRAQIEAMLDDQLGQLNIDLGFGGRRATFAGAGTSQEQQLLADVNTGQQRAVEFQRVQAERLRISNEILGDMLGELRRTRAGAIQSEEKSSTEIVVRKSAR